MGFKFWNAQNNSNDSRMQQLAGMWNNRNSNAVALANASTNAAEVASKFAANPRDAMAEVNFTNAQFGAGQGGTPTVNERESPGLSPAAL